MATEPPHSPEAEISVLGGMLIDAEANARVAQILTPEMFYTDGNQRLFRAMVALWKRHEAVDPVTLVEELKAADDLEAVGGATFIAQVMAAVPTAANIEHHARIVLQKAAFRRAESGLPDIAAAIRAGDPRGAHVSLEAIRRDLDRCGTAPRFRMLTGSDLEALPDPEWLVDGMVPAGGLTVVYGPPGAGKSFFVLGLVLSVGQGIPFLGRSVKNGAGLYVAAEGHTGIKRRLRAWKAANAVADEGPIYFHPDAVNLLDSVAVGELIAAARALGIQFRVVVFDTFARCIPGANENDSGEAGAAIAQADRIRKELGCAVILVHHTNVGGERERGSTAPRGAADAMIQVKADDGLVTVACDKQKEAEPFAKLALRLQPVAGSCVLEAARDQDRKTVNLPTATEREVLVCLADSFRSDGATFTNWRIASTLPERSFCRARTALVKKGYVASDGAKHGAKYTVTERGRALVAASLPQPAKNLPGSQRPLAATLPHSFRSGRNGRSGSGGSAGELPEGEGTLILQQKVN